MPLIFMAFSENKTALNVFMSWLMGKNSACNPNSHANQKQASEMGTEGKNSVEETCPFLETPPGKDIGSKQARETCNFAFEREQVL